MKLLVHAGTKVLESILCLYIDCLSPFDDNFGNTKGENAVDLLAIVVTSPDCGL
jgi:hypothetical protein